MTPIASTKTKSKQWRKAYVYFSILYPYKKQGYYYSTVFVSLQRKANIPILIFSFRSSGNAIGCVN